MEIRRIDVNDDAAAAGRVVQAAYGALADRPEDDDYYERLGHIAVRAAEPGIDVVVAVDGGRVVACLTFVQGAEGDHAEFSDPDAASFRYFGVDPATQGRGVGEAMVGWCIDEARRIGRRRIRIHTLTSMPGAQRLYLRMGFERTPELDEDWDGIIGLAFVYEL